MTSGASDLAALGPRLGWLSAVRLALAGAVLGGTAAAPAAVGTRSAEVVAVVAAYLVGAAVVELLRQSLQRLPLPLLNLTLLLDGVFLALVLARAGGPTSPLAALVSLHLVAVTLLISYRTGLKLALWHSLLLVVAYYAQRAGYVLEPGDPIEATPAVVAVSAFWMTALTTVAASAANERELRRSRSGFASLARLATSLEEAQTPHEVVEGLLVGAGGAFGWRRGAVLLREPDGTVLTVRDGDELCTLPVAGSLGTVASCALADGPQLRRRLDPEADGALASQLPKARNVLVLPLVDDDDRVGVLALERGGLPGARVPRGTLGVAQQFAAHAGLAHRNARLLVEVSRLASTDGLTGVSNRRVFEETLRREAARATRTGEPLSLVLLDVDHFKQVNDRHGHQVGDDVLRHVGRVLADAGRGSDLSARYGGEEFAVLLPACDGPEAVAVADRLRAGLAAGAPVPITASAGVATLGAGAPTPEALVGAADGALYEAKGAGRDRAVLAGRTLVRS